MLLYMYSFPSTTTISHSPLTVRRTVVSPIANKETNNL